jgi:hypothetical protein
MNIVRLHYQLLRLYQINCSLQQLVTGFFDPSGVPTPPVAHDTHATRHTSFS